MKIITTVGARPQFIKAAMLSSELAKHDNVQEIILHTGQHFDANMSDIFFAELGIPTPKYNLGIHKSTHGAMTGSMLIEIEEVLRSEMPNLVIVYGDTDSTLAGALAAAQLQIPVAHIEAGLRSFNRAMPEELNRVLVDHISSLLFAPTLTAADNLRAENRPNSSIHLSGDIMYDAALKVSSREVDQRVLPAYGLKEKAYVLATLHRAENTDDHSRLLTWMTALDEVAAIETVLLPLHPRTRQRIADNGKTLESFSNIQFIDPIGYETMAALTKNARLVATDSGGLQKEAYFHKTPCLILRNETEWGELTENGWSLLVDCDRECFRRASATHAAPVLTEDSQPFGNGTAAIRICELIIDFLK